MSAALYTHTVSVRNHLLTELGLNEGSRCRRKDGLLFDTALWHRGTICWTPSYISANKCGYKNTSSTTNAGIVMRTVEILYHFLLLSQ